MISIFCGDNISLSRKSYSSFILDSRNNNVNIIHIKNDEISSIEKNSFGISNLFHEKSLFCLENILSKKNNRDRIVKLENNNDVDIVIWEEKMLERDIKKYFKHSKIFSHNLPTTIWKMLDNLYPGDLKSNIKMFSMLLETVDENIILYWMQRRIKELILIKDGLVYGKSSASWQIAKLKSQLSRWKYDSLISFYDKLYEIEKITKSSTSSYTLKESIEILYCFYLQ